jgi:hypothetical protein
MWINLYHIEKNNNLFKIGCLRIIFFRGLNFREITTKIKMVYIDDIKITRKLMKQYKKIFYLLKSNKRIYFENKGGLI